ncbi:MAG TPA: hypothetical protein PKG74_03035 [Candidatus Colwellbacteria bacterium]|nr:hypothetical protein [Candidatus Colwellbacteria bacterium]
MEDFYKKLYPDAPANPFGVDPEKIKILPDHAIADHIFAGEAGAVPFNWKPFLGPRELQYWIPFCVSFSRLRCAVAKARKEGLEIDFSERDLGVESGTTKQGNGLHEVSEFFRNTGIFLQKDCFFTNQMISDGWPMWDKIFDLSDVPAGAQRYKGGNHSWVIGGIEAIKQQLAFSPIQIAVPVGDNWEAEIVSPPSVIRSYHAITLYFVGDYLEIQDSVGKEFKKLTLDYPITGAKSFRDLPQNWKVLNKKMYKLVRDPQNQNEVYAVMPGVAKRHIATAETLRLGAQEPDRFWNWQAGDTIATATPEEWALPTAAEIHFDPVE